MDNSATKQIHNCAEGAEKVIRTDNVLAESLPVHYALGEISDRGYTYYQVSVSTDAERNLVCIGEDRERAERFYELIVRNTVTPCTLHDVFEDVFSV